MKLFLQVNSTVPVIIVLMYLCILITLVVYTMDYFKIRLSSGKSCQQQKNTSIFLGFGDKFSL